MSRWVAGPAAVPVAADLHTAADLGVANATASAAAVWGCAYPVCPLRLACADMQGSGERIGMDIEVPFAGIAAKRARLPSWGVEGAYEQAAGVEHAGSPEGAAAAADAGEPQEPWELALLDGSAPGASMSEAFLRQQQQVFAELRASSSDGVAAQRQHAAIFGLAAALLEGPAQQ